MSNEVTEQLVLVRHQIARVSAALPAAGAYDTTPLILESPSAWFVTYYFRYTAGAAGGGFSFKVEVSPDSTPIWHQTTIYAPGTVTPGADTVSTLQREELDYLAVGVGLESFVYGPVDLRRTVERVRLFAKETGVTATPGTLAVIAVFG